MLVVYLVFKCFVAIGSLVEFGFWFAVDCSLVFMLLVVGLVFMLVVLCLALLPVTGCFGWFEWYGFLLFACGLLVVLLCRFL